MSVLGDPSEPHGDIALRLQETDSPVRVSPGSKNLTLMRRLDKEGIEGPASVYISIICDRKRTADPGLSIPVNIRVTDANDNAPQFVNAPYVLNISEVTVVGTRVLQGVRAVDADQPGPYSTVQYSVLPGPNAPVFINSKKEILEDYFMFVNALEGTLVLRKALDYETLSNFTVNIRAQDQGTPPQFSDTTLYVQVVDADDQNPRFYDERYSAILPDRAAQVGATAARAVSFSEEADGRQEDGEDCEGCGGDPGGSRGRLGLDVEPRHPGHVVLPGVGRLIDGLVDLRHRQVLPVGQPLQQPVADLAVRVADVHGLARVGAQVEEAVRLAGEVEGVGDRLAGAGPGRGVGAPLAHGGLRERGQVLPQGGRGLAGQDGAHVVGGHLGAVAALADVAAAVRALLAADELPVGLPVALDQGAGLVDVDEHLGPGGQGAGRGEAPPLAHSVQGAEVGHVA
ncbi:hypothetical protein FOCC_FOCC011547, partial [Frankliniella occidentalis]